LRTLSSGIIRIGILLALVGLIVSLAPPAGAQGQSGLTMKARPAFDGNFKYGEWLPVLVQLENNGLDVQGEVQIRVTGRGATSVFATPVDLPSGSRKLITLYTLPNNFSHALEVQFRSGTDALATESITIKAQPNINFVIGLASTERGALGMLMTAQMPGAIRKVTLVDILLTDIPDRAEGLRTFDVIVINDTDTSVLTPQQRASLETWVRHGGRLVLGGGTGALRTVSGLPESLLPANLRSLQDFETLAGLEEFAGNEPIRVPGPFTAATGNNIDGSILAGDHDLPLVIEKAVGSGFVDQAAVDLSGSPFDAWAGTRAFWENLLGPTAAYSEFLPPDMSSRQLSSNNMTYALSNLPALDLPSIRSLSLLLAIYVGLVGPVNYLILRWRRRLHWAWVTIPMITLIFSAGAFTIGYAMRGSDLLLNRVILAELQPGGSAYVRSYYGLFSPSQTSYEIEVRGSGLVSQLNPDYDPWSSMPAGGGEVVLVQGEPSRLRGLSINQWSMQSFMSEGVWDDVGQITANLVFEKLTLKGIIRNDTNLELVNPVLTVGSNILRLETLSPGEEATINLLAGDLVGQVFGPSLSYRILEDEFNKPSPTGPSRQLQLKQSVLESLMSWGGGSAILSSRAGSQFGSGIQAYLLGWFDTAAEDVSVSGRIPTQQTTGLLYTQLDYRLGDTGKLSVPAGLIPGSLVETPIDGGTCGPIGTSVYIGRGEAIFEFRIPAEFQDVEVESFFLHIGTEGGWSRVPEASLYNWESQSWMALENPIAGRNVIEYQPEMVNNNQVVRVSLASNNGVASGCYYVGLGLEGSR
jgi:hypothetical protein